MIRLIFTLLFALHRLESGEKRVVGANRLLRFTAIVRWNPHFEHVPSWNLDENALFSHLNAFECIEMFVRFN